jgi:choice-of-anchor A domain-containing protein
VIILLGTSAYAFSLGTAGDYNAFVFGNFGATSSDVEGRVAAAGNVNIKNYSIGAALPSNSGNVLVAGGNLTLTSGYIHGGNTVVGGTATLKKAGYDGTVTSIANVPINFSAEETYLDNLSDSLKDLTRTGTVVYKNNGGIYLTGDGTNNLQVFNIDGSKLSSAWGLYNSVNLNNARLILNISGTWDKMMSMAFNLEDSANNVLLNFYDATRLDLGAIGISGSILAPHADVYANNGHLDGTIIAESWNGGMQINNYLFNDDFPPAPVPEPSTFLLFGAGLAGFALWRRKRS